jgi:hypothetical protein
MTTASTSASVLAWAQGVCAKRGAPPHELLELSADATLQQAQDAFHRIARVAHPDLHRNYLREDHLELVTTAYALIAGAYQAFRTKAPVSQEPIAVPLRDRYSTPSAPPRSPTSPPPSGSPPVPVTPSGPAPQAGGAQALSPRAQVYYRKAELALKRGDLKAAVLQLKLAIASEPGSGFLRTALVEVESELKKT